MSSIIGTHNIDVFSLSNPELATFGNLSNEARIRFYDASSPNGVGGYLVGMSNARFTINKETGNTSVGIGTTIPYNDSALHVQGTIATSNITTYNTDKTVYYDNKNIANISNISFNGNLYKGNEIFKTSQWLNTTSVGAICFPSNVAIGTSDVTGFGDASNLLCIGNVYVTGYVTASNFVSTGTQFGIYNLQTIYNASVDGSKTILTNDATPANRILYTFNLNAGRYIITATIPYQNLTPMTTIDTTNWATIGLYQTNVASFTAATSPVRFTPLTAIGSTVSTDIDSITFTWFLDTVQTNQAEYVIAISGKGHEIKFAPNGTAATLYNIPIRGIGYDDSISVRQSLQVNPIRYTENLTGTKSVFYVSGVGYYTGTHTSNVDFYQNGSRLMTDKYALSASTFDGTQTTFTINTTPALLTNDKVDITIWPKANSSSYYSSGYLYQQINTTSSPWQPVSGVGSKLPSSCIIDGDLYVKGNIWGGCNTAVFPSGSYYSGVPAINIAANTIGSTNLIDGAVTVSKLNLSTSSVVGIGLTTPNSIYNLDVYGKTHVANDIVCDTVVDTPSLGYSGKTLSIQGCANPMVSIYSITSETVALASGNTYTVYAPYQITIRSGKLPKFTVNVAPSGAPCVFDITVNGSSIYGASKPTISVGNVSASSGTISTNPTIINENDKIVVSVSGTPGTGALGGKVYLYST